MALALTGQKVSVQGGAVSTITTGTIATTNGNLIHVDLAYEAAFVSFADVALNTWTAAVADWVALGGWRAQSVYAKSITGSGIEAFTIVTGSNGYPCISAVEISGADTSAPLDQIGSISVSSGTTSPSVSTAGATGQNDEIVCGAITTGDASGTVTEASGFTTTHNLQASGSAHGLHSATKIISATGVQTYNPTTANSVRGGWQIATYKQAGAGGASRPVKMAGEWGGYAGESGGFAG